jgi:hypothetical protein
LNTRRLAALLVIAACAALALFVVAGSPPDVMTWLSDRPEIVAALVLGAAVIFAAVIIADSREPRG